MLGARKFFYRKVHDLAAGFHQYNAVCQQLSFTKIVRNKHDRLAHALLERAKLFLDFRAGDWVERGKSFVQNQNWRIGGQGARHAYTLALSSGKLARIAGRQFAIQPDESEQFPHPRLDSRAIPAFDARDKGDIAFHCEMRKQPAILDDVANASPQTNRVPLLRWSAR